MPTIYVRDIRLLYSYYLQQSLLSHQESFLERTEDNLDKSLKADGLAREDKRLLKEKSKTYKKRVVVLALLLVFGVLAVVKYHNFAIENVNGIIKALVAMAGYQHLHCFFRLEYLSIHSSRYHMLLMYTEAK